MDENNNNFDFKPVHEPVLDEATRQRIESHTGFYGANKWFIWAIVVALVIIGILVYLVFFTGNGGGGSPAKIDAVIEAPAQVPSGGEVVYKIRIENQDTSSLAAGELEIVLPEGSEYLQSTPPAKNQNGTLYAVPELTSGQNAVLFVKLKLAGSLGDDKELSAKYRYRFKGVSSEFVKDFAYKLQLNAADVLVEWNGPVNVSNGQPVVYELKYKNNSNKDISGSRVQVEYPEGFTMSAGSPQPDTGNNTWTVGSLAPGQEGKITVQGSFSGTRGGETKTINAQFLVLGSSGSFFTQGTSSFATTIASTPLSVSVNSDIRASNTARPGERVSFTVDYSNNSNVAARGVNVSVTIDSKAVDPSTFSSEDGIISGNTITWNASADRRLETLAPGANGQLRFSFRIKDPPVKDQSKNLDVKINSQISSQEHSVPYKGNMLVMKISTVARLAAEAVYSGGNLPPKVGKATNYTVTLRVTNTTSDITEGVVTAFMPLEPSSFQGASGVRFDSATGKVTWSVGSVPAGSGSFSPSKEVSFTIKLTPQSSMANRPVDLLKTVTFTGKDTFTGDTVNLSAETVSTLNAEGGGSGNVVP